MPATVGGAAGALSGVADSRLFVRMTRSRLWIAVVGVLLTGVVALNVAALSFTAQGTVAEREAAKLEQDISDISARITAGGSNERLGRVAAGLGLVVPDPGAIGYLRLGKNDARIAAERLRSGELTAGAPAASAAAAPAEPVPGGEPAAEVPAVAPEPATASGDAAAVAAEPAAEGAAPYEPTAAPSAPETGTPSGGLTGP